jgi:ATP-dependent protease ClpP protease subunit
MSYLYQRVRFIWTIKKLKKKIKYFARIAQQKQAANYRGLLFFTFAYKLKFMPFSGEHAARLKSPEMQHIRVRRTSGSGDGNVQGVKVPNSIDIIWYIIKTKEGEAPIAQTLRFPLSNWTEEAAKEWLKKNNIKFMSFEPASEKKTKSEFDFKFVTDLSEDTADIYLYGGIGEGEKVDGDMVAKEIFNLNQMGITTINERINGPGGNVTNGYSIVSANLNSKATINTYNDGIAASMMAIIWLTGENTYMADYAQLMFHEPSMMGETIKTTQDEKTKRALVSFRDSLSQIMQNRTKKTKEECDSILEAETWYNAKTAKEAGIIKASEVISYAKKRPNIKNNMTTDEILMAVAATYDNNNSKHKKMELILNALGLSKESTEEEAVNEITSLKTAKDDKELTTLKAEKAKLVQDKTDALAEVTKVKAEKETAETSLKAKQTEVDNLNIKLLDTVIDQAIMLGTFVEKDRDALKVQFKDNIDGLKFVISNSSSKALNIIDQLNPKKDEEDVKASWGFSEWSKNNPKGLADIKAKDLKKYNDLGKKSFGDSWTDEV